MITQLPNRHQAITNSTTPFVECSIGAHTVRLYWTPANQVLGVVWGGYDKERNTCLVNSHLSSGGGYCKEDHILALMFNDIGVKPKGMALWSGGIPYEYKVGGNYYRVPASKIRKVKRGK